MRTRTTRYVELPIWRVSLSVIWLNLSLITSCLSYLHQLFNPDERIWTRATIDGAQSSHWEETTIGCINIVGSCASVSSNIFSGYACQRQPHKSLVSINYNRSREKKWKIKENLVEKSNILPRVTSLSEKQKSRKRVQKDSLLREYLSFFKLNIALLTFNCA